MRLLRVWIFLSAVPVACFGQYLRGVNIAGAEFGYTQLPGRIGTTHTYNSIRTFQYFAARSLNLIRLQIRWERLQTTVQGPLDPTNLNALKQDIEWARMSGCKVILDAHNYGRYRTNGQPPDQIIDNGLVKAADLADFLDAAI